MSASLDSYLRRLTSLQPWRWRGQVIQSLGNTIVSSGPAVFVGECCEVMDSSGEIHLAEAIGFRGSQVISMPSA